mgnify:FL=1
MKKNYFTGFISILSIISCSKIENEKKLTTNVDYNKIQDSIKKVVENELVVKDSIRRDSIAKSIEAQEKEAEKKEKLKKQVKNYVIYTDEDGKKIKIYKDKLPPDLIGHDLSFYTDGAVYDQGAHTWVTDYLIDYQAGCDL